MRRRPVSLEPGRWQRLSPWAVLLVLIRGIAVQARQHLPLLVGAGAGVAYTERVGAWEIALGGVVLLLLAALVSVLYYRRFRFRLEEDVLVVEKGLLEHREFKATADHVQHIAIHQPPYMRPFGVVRWRLETTAGEASGIELPGIHRSVADALSQRLAVRSSHSQTEPAGEGAASSRAAHSPAYAITPWELTLHGLTSRSIYVAAAMLSPLLRPLERWAHDSLPRNEALREALGSPALAVGLGAVALLASLMLLGVAAAWWRYHGYLLYDEGERYVQHSGLLQRQEQSLSLRRLQVIEWVQTGLGRMLGRGYLICRQFGAIGTGGAEEARQFLVPGLRWRVALPLARDLWPRLDEPRRFSRVSRFYRRAVFLRVLLLSGTAALVLGTLGEAWRHLPGGRGSLLAAALTVGGLLLFAALVAELRWRSLGWARQGDYLWIRRGLVGRRTALFPLGNAVAVELQQSWLQRRRGLVSLHLHLATSRQTLPFLERSEALALADLLLASVESAQTRGDDGGSEPR